VRLLPSSRRGRLLVAVVGVAAATVGVVAMRRTRAPEFPTAEVTRGDFQEVVETRGEIKPFRSVLVTAPYQAGELQIL